LRAERDRFANEGNNCRFKYPHKEVRTGETIGGMERSLSRRSAGASLYETKKLLTELKLSSEEKRNFTSARFPELGKETVLERMDEGNKRARKSEQGKKNQTPTKRQQTTGRLRSARILFSNKSSCGPREDQRRGKGRDKRLYRDIFRTEKGERRQADIPSVKKLRACPRGQERYRWGRFSRSAGVSKNKTYFQGGTRRRENGTE